MSMYDVNEQYINLVKEAGTPPTDAWQAIPNPVWFELFKNFVDGTGKAELVAYADALDFLEMDKQDPVAVWNSVKADWSQDTKLVFGEHQVTPNAELLRSEMVNDATSNLEDLYTSEFLPLVNDIISGAFDTKEEEEDEQQLVPETRVHDSLDDLISQLAEVKQGKPTESLMGLLDLNELEATEKEIEELFDDLDQYTKATEKEEALGNLRSSMKISDQDIQKLIDELNSPKEKGDEDEGMSAELEEKLDKLLGDLVETVPNPSNRQDFLSNVVDDNFQLSSGDDLDEFFDMLSKLSQTDDKNLRRSVRDSVNGLDIEKLIEALESADLGENRPPAVSADKWSLDWVAQRNYQHMKDAEGGTPIPVVVNGDYVLIGDEWNSDDDMLAKFRNSLTPAWRGEQGYPGETGLTETGDVVIEKGTGAFNAGKVIVSGINSARNRKGIETSVKVESRKKVVFQDA